jgi:uncharacterized protein DUF6776
MKKGTQHRVVIASHHPGRRRALVAGVAATLALGAWGLYSYTRATTISDFDRARTESEQLREENRDLSQKLRAALAEGQTAKNQLTYLSRSQQIDDSACTTVKQSLSSQQAETTELREQLAFYRGIVSPNESAGVRVFEFKVYPVSQGVSQGASQGSAPGAAQAASWRYDMVLIQSVRHEKSIDGSITVGIEGQTADGRKQTLKLSDLATDDSKNLLFSFKYFEEFSGGFRFPDGFRPVRVVVTLKSEDIPEVTDDFDWAKIAQETRPS